MKINKGIPLTVFGASLATGVFVLASMMVLATPQKSSAWAPTSWGWFVELGSGDKFRTYDTIDSSIFSTDVDWPIRWVFKIGANINKVKHWIDGVGSDPTIYPDLPNNPLSPMHHIYNDTAITESDTDSGRKQGTSCGDYMDYHMRFYANKHTDANYNDNWGYWIVSSSHRDYEYLPQVGGPNCNKWYRSIEGDEQWWRDRIAVGNSDPCCSNWTVYPNHYNLGNKENSTGNQWWPDSTHLVSSDGYANVVHVP